MPVKPAASSTAGCPLVFIHVLVCPAHYIIDRAVFVGIINGNSAGNINLFPDCSLGSALLDTAFIKLLQEFFPVHVVLINENCCKLVPSYAEYGAVAEHAADYGSGFLQVDISLVMTVLVVDLFQFVAVKDADGKLQGIFLIDTALDVAYEDVKRALVVKGREGIGVSQIVEVGYVLLQVGSDAAERSCQDAYLIITLVIKPVVVVAHVYLFGNTGKLYEGLYYPVRIPSDEDYQDNDKHDNNYDDDVGPELPALADFHDGNRYIQVVSVYECSSYG